MNDPFEKARNILQILSEHGYEAYFVGGSVRDFLQNMAIHDIDIATSATPEQMMGIFPKTFPVGIEHGTVLVRYQKENYEVTTFRSEAGYKDHRHPDQVHFESSIYKDLARRDFTMNAMAMDSDGNIIDPYSGQRDIQQRILRTVGQASERLKEDPLRILRAARFTAQLNMQAEDELKTAMTNAAPYIEHLAIERIRVEFTKLLAGKSLDSAIGLFKETKLLTYLPEMSHFNFDSVSTKAFSSLKSDEERWAMLLIVSDCHNPGGFLKSWRFSNREYKNVMGLIEAFQIQKEKPWNRLSLYYCGMETACSVERMKTSLNLSKGALEEIDKIWDRLTIKNRSELAVDGKDLCQWLNKKGGPWTGELLKTIEESVIKGKIKNERSMIRKWVRHVD